MLKLVRNNKGFSVVEVVIAMAVVGLVTAAALVIMIGSVEITQKTLNEANAENFVANAVECYIAANDNDGNFNLSEFNTLMYTDAGYQLDGGGEYKTCNLPGGYQGEIIVNQQSINICVKDTATNELYISWLTYARGARR